MVLGNGLTCTWMNNARKHSPCRAERPACPIRLGSLPAGQSADRLGYDGAGRVITKRYLLSGTGDGGYSHPGPSSASPPPSTAPATSSTSGALHAEERSSLYEPFDSNQIPQGGYDSLDRLLQYQRGVLATSGGCRGQRRRFDHGRRGDHAAQYRFARSYLLDSLGNWRNTAFTPVGGSSQTEIRQHNGLNEITRRSNPIDKRVDQPDL